MLASLSIQKISSETRKYFLVKILVVQPFIANFAFEKAIINRTRATRQCSKSSMCKNNILPLTVLKTLQEACINFCV